MVKTVLGLDIGSNSVGFALLRLFEKNGEYIFEELESNSIVFSEPNKAEDRRNARSNRRRNQRKRARKKFVRKLFVTYGIAQEAFVENTTNYLNSFVFKDKDVYRLRKKAVNGDTLTKEEFILATYSILTDRGYNNMFADDADEEQGVINESITANEKRYKKNNYLLPSQVLTSKRERLEEVYLQVPVRNKKGDYSNSLDRNMHKIELAKVVQSQCENRDIFTTKEECQKFLDELLNESKVNTPFYQRHLKSFEDMVAYCSFYNAYNSKGTEKRVPLANLKYIEFVLRQTLENYKDRIVDKKGELKTLSTEDIQKVIDFWVGTPSANDIHARNVLNPISKDLQLSMSDKSASHIILNISAHRKLLEVLTKYSIEFKSKDNSFYNNLLLQLYYFKNKSSRIEHIKTVAKNYDKDIEEDFVHELSLLDGLDGFGKFSLRFINEILELVEQGKRIHEAQESIGYFSQYVGMPTYNYLPPLEPNEDDIKWLTENIPYFKKEHLFYQPKVAPKVKRVISVLRLLINQLIEKYGVIDEIRIESSKDLNTKNEQDDISKNQSKNKAKNDAAKKLLEAKNRILTDSNIERAKLFIEQGKCTCLYTGEVITEDEAFDENETEVEHFIPRSVIWINSYKNKILVKKKANQDKSNKHPIVYLKSKGEWENFIGRVKNDTFIDKNKKEWLTNEEIINSVMENEYWQDKFLNDTRTAIKVIAKYLNHYLYPKQKEHGKDEKKHIQSVSGRAIWELKNMWGIHAIMPKSEDGKKDRDTNYHHTIDAFAVGLCGNSAIKTLNNHFKQNENRFQTKAQKEKLKGNVPYTKEGLYIATYLKKIVKKYEANEKYVCPYAKRKTNTKGFKDGNLKLYVAKNTKNGNDVLAEIEKVYIDTSLLEKGNFKERRTDSEVKKEVSSIQDRLQLKQSKISLAIEEYATQLLELRRQDEGIKKEIKKIDEKIKTSKKEEEHNEALKQQIIELRGKRKDTSKKMTSLKCSYPVKGGKKQIVRVIKLTKPKIEETSGDAILFSNRKENSIERLSVSNFKEALKNNEPFVAKENENTLNVQLFNSEDRGQVVGLNYFSSIVNSFPPKINERYKQEKLDIDNALVLYKNDIIKVEDSKKDITNYYIFNGGGNVAGSNNKVSIKNINTNSFEKVSRDGEVKMIKEDMVSPSKTIVVTRVSIDFFGNISEVK